MKKVKINLHLFDHKGGQQIGISFPEGQYKRSLLYPIDDVHYTQTHRCWYVPYHEKSINQLKEYFEIENLEDIQHFKINTSQTDGYTRIELDLDGNHRLKIRIIFNKELATKKLREIQHCRYESKNKVWLLPASEGSIQRLEEAFPDQINYKVQIRRSDRGATKIVKSKKTTKPFIPSQQKALDELERQLILNRYSIHTRKSYLSQFKSFLSYYRRHDPTSITKEEVENYLIHCIKERYISESTQNQIINAIKFYFEKILKRPRIQYQFTRPKKPLQLPNVLSKDEVQLLFEHTDNIKHKCILVIIYSAGLRLSELIKLRLRDINKSRRVIFIKAGKGKKDRYTVLADNVLPLLNQYQKMYKPRYWLFEGQAGGQYSVRSVQSIFSNARDRAMINPFATVHTLRHSFATHCLEAGFSTALIKEALGHKSVSTTERYLHISTQELSKLQSPLDDL